MNREKQKAEIEASLRRAEDALRRRDPDTMAGRMGSPASPERLPDAAKAKSANKALR
ncbi:MAG: hypothetical protein ABL894_14950 [Hyphomicrobium sp.]